MSYEILYSSQVVKVDIPKLTSADKQRVKKAIESKLTTEPDLFGKPLRKSAKGYWSLRVGDLRVIFRIEQKKVKIFLISNRSEVYKDTNL